MGIEVRCPCGQLVVADEAHRGQVVQCPVCKAGVLVPVATANRREPTDEERRAATEQSRAEQRGAAVGELVLGLVIAAAGAFFLWHLPLGKLLVLGGLATAAHACQRL